MLTVDSACVNPIENIYPMQNTTKEHIEIMAPVGCWESLAAAIQAGATSVYFGIEYLNMRARSSANFTTDDLHKIVAICREAGVKTYLTLNTVMYPEDLPLMHTIVDNAKAAGLDAIIASDIAVMQYARSQGVEIHLSTQLNIANTEALRFYAQFADVVVLARELNMAQVASIHRDIIEQHICGPKGELLRIEMFCHGALCMAVSGKCYLSLNNLGYSKGSRGLFVPSRVIGIFTDTTISLSSRLRQRPDHYTIRTGRNLPDKEFRSLRTVIVTAAVYRGFNSMLPLR